MKSYFLTSLHWSTYLYNILVATLMLVRCQNSSRRITENIHPAGPAKASYAKCRSINVIEAHGWLCIGRRASTAAVFWALKLQLCVFITSAIRMAKQFSCMPPKIVLKSHRLKRSLLNHHLIQGGLCGVDYSYCYLRENGM